MYQLRLIRIGRVPRFIVRPVGKFIADFTGNDRFRTEYAVMYMAHPKDVVKWILRYLGN